MKLKKSHDWVGFDFDGTLAEQTHNTDGSIGKPIGKMVNRAKRHLENGDTVKIFTARAGHAPSERNIKRFCKEHFGCELEITNKKDHALRVFYDDKARQARNGEIVGESSYGE